MIKRRSWNAWRRFCSPLDAHRKTENWRSCRNQKIVSKLSISAHGCSLLQLAFENELRRNWESGKRSRFIPYLHILTSDQRIGLYYQKEEDDMEWNIVGPDCPENLSGKTKDPLLSSVTHNLEQSCISSQPTESAPPRIQTQWTPPRETDDSGHWRWPIEGCSLKIRFDFYESFWWCTTISNTATSNEPRGSESIQKMNFWEMVTARPRNQGIMIATMITWWGNNWATGKAKLVFTSDPIISQQK